MKRLCLFSTLLILLATVSCNRYYYKPNGVNTPLFTDGGQAHLNAAGSIGADDNDGNSYVFDLQGSVSPIKHLGIIANYSTWSYRPDYPDEGTGHVNLDSRLLEGGIGTYYASKGKKVKLVTDLYVGYGVGSFKSDIDMKMRRFFVQPGIGIRSPWFDAAFNLRVINMKFTDFNAKGRDDNYLMSQNLIDQIGRRIDSKNYTFAEPSLTIRAGYKFAKVQLQMVLANDITNAAWDYSPARFTAGLYFTLEDALDAARGK
jgi:hypothetical protein